MAAANSRWRQEFLIYACITVPCSFFPVACFYLMRGYDGQYPTMPEILENGSVLSIAITMASEAFSRLLVSGNKWQGIKISASGLSLCVIILDSVFYALRYARRPTDSTLFVDLCFITLFLSVVLSTFTRFLPEDDT